MGFDISIHVEWFSGDRWTLLSPLAPVPQVDRRMRERWPEWFEKEPDYEPVSDYSGVNDVILSIFDFKDHGLAPVAPFHSGVPGDVSSELAAWVHYAGNDIIRPGWILLRDLLEHLFDRVTILVNNGSAAKMLRFPEEEASIVHTISAEHGARVTWEGPFSRKLDHKFFDMVNKAIRVHPNVAEIRLVFWFS